MGTRTGSADLPLHGGRVPEWLAARMARLGQVIVEALVLHEGPRGVLRRLSHPFWFQAFGAVMGMDWHSSGITTSVLAALKRGLAGREQELGLTVCGGRGKQSRRTPAELTAFGERTGHDGAALARASRLVAKVDSACVQDGFQLYLHGFIVARDGSWCVVQQGMDLARRQARRYHWRSEGLESFVDAPHAAIEGEPRGSIVNLADHRAAASRALQLQLVAAGPGAVARALSSGALEHRHNGVSNEVTTRVAAAQAPLPHLALPAHHEVRAEDVITRRMHGALAAAAEAGPRDFPELLLVPGVGARTLRTLALVAEVIHGAPCRFSDPARFSLALGGKDGHPFPVPLAVYDQTIARLKDAVQAARLGNDERLAALQRLDAESRRLERLASGPPFEALVAEERARSHEYGGRTVSGPASDGNSRRSDGSLQRSDGGREANDLPPAPSARRAKLAGRGARNDTSIQLALPGLTRRRA